jgi:hypothetical protein
LLLRKKLIPTKWLSLFFLAIGVSIVQIQQTTAGHVMPISSSTVVGSAHEFHVHVMSPSKRFRGSHSRLLHFRSFRNGPQRLESRALGSKRPIISFLPYTRSSPYLFSMQPLPPILVVSSLTYSAISEHGLGRPWLSR